MVDKNPTLSSGLVWAQGNTSGNAEFCNAYHADRTKWKLTLQDINKTPVEPKTERGCSRRHLFRH